MVRRYLHETDALTPTSVFYQPARSASERLAKLMGGGVFDFPKDETILAKFVSMATDSESHEDIALDFFAGSGTTGHAVMAQNLADGGSRKYVLVQLPEPLNPENKDQKSAADYCDKLGKPRTIAELTKERLRRAGAKVLEEWEREAAKKAKEPAELALEGGEAVPAAAAEPPDTGFRVFKLDSSNIRAWDPDANDLAGSLEAHQRNLKADRTKADILFEVLLKLGLDLTAAMEAREVAGKTVHSIGAGTLLACLAPEIGRADAEALALGIAAWHKELAPAGESTVIFRDSAFQDDVAKTNLAAILEQHGLRNVRSL